MSEVPDYTDLNRDSITDAVIAVNSSCPDHRTKFIFERLVKHLHDFVRETSLTTEEWATALQFLTKTGQSSTDTRREFYILSDILGVSSLVEMINNITPPGATEVSALGPFFSEDAEHLENGASIASEGKGDYMFVEGRVLDTKGNPVKGAVIDTWETDGEGKYDIQYENQEQPDCRGRFKSAEDGSFSYRAVLPVPYPIPDDGPVGTLIEKLGRHVYRPAHLHLIIEAPGYEKLVTALYFEGDPYIGSDVIFGVRKSLVVRPELIEDVRVTEQRGFKGRKPHYHLKYDFVLATGQEVLEARASTKRV